jgi:hypothetical protein
MEDSLITDHSPSSLDFGSGVQAMGSKSIQRRFPPGEID